MPFQLIPPVVIPPLDPGFRPAVLANRQFRRRVEESGQAVRLVIALERLEGACSRFETRVYPEGHPESAANLPYVERLVKFLLWQRGGWRVRVGGPPSIGEHIRRTYAPGGARAFDYDFMGEQVYRRPFTVVVCTADQAPPAHEPERPLGGHLEGCRVGFDLGASDLKVSAVVDGQAVFSQEIVWDPRSQSDPDYHYRHIREALLMAASKLPRLDAIGGSSAGIIINNRSMVASLFRGVPAERFDEIRNLFLRLRDAFGVPLEVINDGEVTALAGSMSLGENGILGVALGSSQAGGYVTAQGNITDWLNELAFVPVDYNPEAPVDEWSGDRGCGVLYFSQQCVFRLAPAAGISIPSHLSLAARLEYVQEQLAAGHEGAARIWQTIGAYLGYALAHYADFYDLRQVLILGRVTSGQGGPLIVESARQVLTADFPALAGRINVQLPDERSRRVGQSIAAASLPAAT